MISKSTFLGILLILLVSAVIYNVTAYAMRDEPQYYSYTKTVKSCGNQGDCVLRDLLVQCLGDSVIDITLVGESLDVPEAFEGGDMFSWCE
jgi:hypothetical protein